MRRREENFSRRIAYTRKRDERLILFLATMQPFPIHSLELCLRLQLCVIFQCNNNHKNVFLSPLTKQQQFFLWKREKFFIALFGIELGIVQLHKSVNEKRTQWGRNWPAARSCRKQTQKVGKEFRHYCQLLNYVCQKVI